MSETKYIKCECGCNKFKLFEIEKVNGNGKPNIRVECMVCKNKLFEV